jgi:mRNA interferase RelE/StbE
VRLAALDDPRQLGAALQGDRLRQYWRYRVGDFRIICDIQDNRLVILVIEIGHRRQIYR